MKKNLKKVFAVGLAATMVMGTASVAMADTPAEEPLTKVEVSETVLVTDELTFEFQKIYTTTNEYSVTSKGSTPETIPAEVLDFEISPADTNPDDTMIIVEDPTIATTPQNVTLTIPKTYTKVGKYNYTVSEVAGHTQGVTYSDATFNVQVLVSWDENHENLLKQVTLSSGEAGNKTDKIINNYDLGDLSINKTVTGNLADENKDFDVVVTFTAEQYEDPTGTKAYNDVKSTITYVDVDYNDTTNDNKTIAPTDWKNGTARVTISLRHDETVKFENIPAGITYVVDESDYTTYDSIKGKDNDENGYDTPKYSSTSAAEAVDTVSNITDKMDADADDKAFIVNNKETEVNTGISLDSMPYLMTLALSAMGALGFAGKKRKEEDEI